MAAEPAAVGASPLDAALADAVRALLLDCAVLRSLIPYMQAARKPQGKACHEESGNRLHRRRGCTRVRRRCPQSWPPRGQLPAPWHGRGAGGEGPGQEDKVTLRRHTAAQQAAGGAGAAGVITPPSMASPPSKRRAAAPPPSEPPRKHATAPSVKTETPAAAAPEAPAAPPPYKRRPPHRIERESSLPPGFVAPAAGIKTETPAAVKQEAPVAPPHVPYTASTGRPLQAAFAAAQAALAASPPADEGPSVDAPTTGVKTETPAAVKGETPAAPSMPAVAAPDWASPAPPSAFAAAAPPVKMERD